MVPITAFKDQTVAVLGLGRSGLATAAALLAGGARVVGWDDAEARRKAASSRNVTVAPLTAEVIAGARCLVPSPGIPLHHPAPHPAVALARTARIDVIGDIELLAQAAPSARFAAVTGTNGKSTVTALLGHILRAAGHDALTGGNLGLPALSLAPPGAGTVYVLELSSYQLDLTATLAPEVAVLINISPDHLDRHGGMDGYVAAKKRIFARQRSDQAAVVGVDDPIAAAICRELRQRGQQRVIPISATGPVAGGVFAVDGRLIDDTEGRGEAVANLAPIVTLPGMHNWQNAAAAFAAARALGVAPGRAAQDLPGYPGLAHRMELVAVIDGVRYVNDSKATNAAAAGQALACYDSVYWIVGGRAKQDEWEALALHLDGVARAFLIGEASERLATALTGRVPVERSGNLATAVAQASSAALDEGRADPVVLLSPACASFDQFADFEARGAAFRTLVEALPGARGGGGTEAVATSAPVRAEAFL
ncbi:MAG: UDP-N-acetylmuramoyl-L-alanine--D-glutamate ligase [Alphaproteobacteria bacterium]|jgi:UDP-N-acetylmuramoylalanine--D-glutamate ligase|nr:UDP-N-acetylmuramoyl-L-alanine--D-glutamate ligase [Alphaproteobacteria bacterium]MDP6517323.1 UDP-N-acetylmuramoyl-L-alanine--D-glutamate ligase [Alphaproteobacteria bacterium]